MLVFTSTKSQSRGLISFDSGRLKQHWLRHTHSFYIAFCVQWCLFYVWTIKSGFQPTFPMPPIYQALVNPHTHKATSVKDHWSSLQRVEELEWLCLGLPLFLSVPRNFGSIEAFVLNISSLLSLAPWDMTFCLSPSSHSFFFSLLSEFIKTI